MRSLPHSSLSKGILAGGLALTLSLATGCSQLARLGLGLTSIEAIKAQPKDYSTVYVQGTVTNRAGLLGTSVYELKQGDSAIWVLTKQPAPEIGATVRLAGKVQYQNIVISSVDLGQAYLEEIERVSERKP